MTPQLTDTLDRPIDLPPAPRDNLLRLRELYEFAWNAAFYAASADLVTTQRMKQQRAEALMLISAIAENIAEPLCELRDERKLRMYGLEKLRALTAELLASTGSGT